MNKSQNVIRAKLGATAKHHPGDQAAIDELRQKLTVSLAEDYLSDVANTHPPLTAAQRLQLVSILVTESGGL